MFSGSSNFSTACAHLRCQPYASGTLQRSSLTGDVNLRSEGFLTFVIVFFSKETAHDTAFKPLLGDTKESSDLQGVTPPTVILSTTHF